MSPLDLLTGPYAAAIAGSLSLACFLMAGRLVYRDVGARQARGF